MRVVQVDGGPEAVRALSAALAEALRGGPPVLPIAPDAQAVAQAMRPGDPVDPPTAVLIATSGSTGQPKGVLLSATALRASANATHQRLGGPGRWLLATPAQYIGGLQVLVRSLLADTEPGVVDLSTGFRPDAFAAAAGPVLAADGPHYTALVPTQLLRLLEAGGEALAAARAFDAIVVGGAPVPPTLRTQARSAGVRVVRAYGMTETAGGCVYDGLPLDGVRVRVRPDPGRPEPGRPDRGRPGEPGEPEAPDGVGRIEIAGDVLSHGYRHGGRRFSGGWFTTDDLGRLDADGRLEVLGRADDVINTGGVKVAAQAVERSLREHPDVRDACAVGLPDPQWGEVVAALVVAADPARPPAAETLAAVVRAAVGRAAVPKVVRFTQELPLRGPGKVDRTAVKEQLHRE